MAEFNPFLPQPNIPDWTNAPGRLIDGSGIGEIFGKLATEITGQVNTAKQNRAANSLYDSADAAAEDGRVESMANAAGIPKDVAKAMNRADLMKKAFATGKYNESTFYQKMDVWSKEMRVRYPQYKDVVDQQLARVMGRTPANLEMDAVRTQMEAELTAVGKEKNDRQQFIQKNPGVLSPDEEVELMTSTDGNRVNQLMTKGLLLSSDRARFEHMVKELEGNQKADAIQAAPAVSQLASNIERSVYLGAVGKVGSLQNLRAEIERMREGGFDKDETILANQMIQEAIASVDQAWVAGTTTPGANGKSLADYFANDPTAWNAQKAKIDQIKKDLGELMTGKAGVFEWNATAQSALANSGMEKLRDALGDDFVTGMKAVENLIGQENMYLVYDKITEGKDPIADYMTGLLTGKALKAGNIGDAAEAIKGVDPRYRTEANQGSRGMVEALVKTASDPAIPLEGRKKAAMTLYSDTENKFFRSLKDSPDSAGLSSREKAFQRLTTPEQEKTMKDLGLGKAYTEFIKNTSPALYATVVEQANETNTGTKYLDITFNPNTLMHEARLNKSLVKDPAALMKWVQQVRSGKSALWADVPKDIPLEDLDQIKNGIDAIQKLNMINGALARALKSENPGMTTEDQAKALHNYMGNFAATYAKKEYWQWTALSAVGSYLKDLATGKIASDNNKRVSEGYQKLQQGEDFGIVPTGDMNFNVLEGGSVTSPVGTTPDTGDDTANAVLAFIHGAEGADYSTVFGGGKVDAAGMTVADVINRTNNAGSSAFGAVQVMKDTLADLVKRGVVTPEDKMDQGTQDKIGLALMKQAGYDDWKAGKISDNVFADKLAGIWASLPLKGGKSKYDGVGPNKATVSRGQVLAMLDELR